MSLKVDNTGNTNIPQSNPPSIKDKIVEFFGHAYTKMKMAFHIGAGNFAEMGKNQSTEQSSLKETHEFKEIETKGTPEAEQKLQSIQKNPEDTNRKSFERTSKRTSDQLNKLKSDTPSNSETPLAPLPKNTLGDQVFEAGRQYSRNIEENLSGKKKDWYDKAEEDAQKIHDAKVEQKRAKEAAASEKKPDIEEEN